MSRVIIITLSSLLLVGLIGAVTIGFVTNWGKDEPRLTSTSKAVQAICQPTDYKEACMQSLSTVKTDDPKELVKAAFASAKNELFAIVDNSTVLKELEKDPITAVSVKDCKELFQDAMDDFQRSWDEVGKFDGDKIKEMLSNLKIWISATRTYQETCLDGFENTTTDAGAKMRKVLQTAMQMSSNGLAIVNDLSTLLTTLDISSFNGRKLLSHNPHRSLLTNYDDSVLLPDDDEEDDKRRKLLVSYDQVIGHSSSDGAEYWPEWVDGFRRRLLEAPNLANDLKAKANVVVAKDGSGKYKTIEDALKDVPKDGKESFVIYIKEGVYEEYLVLFKWMTNVVFVGDGPTKTRITNNKNFVDGVKTFKTATVSVLGDFFMATDIGIENSAGAIKHQAVAFRAQSDKSIFFNCHFDGYQDTLYAHTYRQFYRDCRITGTIDFIFGDAASFFQNCVFVVRKPLDNQNCIVTAQGRMERHQPTGIFIHNSRFEGDPEYLPLKNKNKAYLGRPWKEYSKTIIMESEIGDFIQGEGWLPWEGNFALETCYYGEYNNVGAGSGLANRVKWTGIKNILVDRAETFMPPKLFDNDDWIRTSRVPYQPNLSTIPISEISETPAGAPLSSISGESSFGSSSSSGSSSDDSSLGGSYGRSSSSGSSSGGSSSSGSSYGGSSSSGSSSGGSSSSGSSYGGSSSSGSSSGRSSSSGSSYGGSSSSGSSSGGSSSGSFYGGSSSSGSSSDGSLSSGHSKHKGSQGSSSSGSSSSGTSHSSSSTPSGSSSSGTSSKGSTSSGSGASSTPLGSSYGSSSSGTSSERSSSSGAGYSSGSSSSTEPETTVEGSEAPSSTSSISDAPAPASSLGIELEIPSPTPTPGVSIQVGPVTVRELERMLMENEEITEGDETNDDMSGNVPDGDEPSPARAEPPSPAPSPNNIAITPSLTPSPAQSPLEEVSDWLPPTTAPSPDEEADKLPPPTITPPKPSSGTKSSTYELHIILSGLVMWVALFM
ncbi:probable pectinesterase/pectinesterase inhibitor 21 [Amaranthus tricolor]|uniref:probable pectinesterase/pectinesterase inhibitor 21 n=1 Tax=Amaranthus tricolor TaxID=29722 RepID=UPI002582AB77|nr:probable pectinesterase/pectinesterase inhibitor 21 [Amaranthus tricolor]